MDLGDTAFLFHNLLGGRTYCGPVLWWRRFCERTPSRHESGVNSLKKEIQALGDGVQELKNKDKKAD